MRFTFHFIVWIGAVILVLSISACAGGSAVPPPDPSPGITVEITKDSCPSIEVSAGMRITWINQVHEDRAVIIEHMDSQGGTDLLQFAIGSPSH